MIRDLPAGTTPDLVAAVGDRLTPTERRIAEAVLAEPTLLAFGTVSDLADRVGTSRPSIVRFAGKLGFDGYSDLQTHVRRTLSHQLSRPSDRIRHDGSTTMQALAALEGAMDSVSEAAQGCPRTAQRIDDDSPGRQPRRGSLDGSRPGQCRFG